MKREAFIKIILEGPPRERGLSYGKACRDLIGENIERYRKWFLERTPHAWEKVASKAEEFVPEIKRACPELLEEVQGIAEGSGCSFCDILALNSRSELIRFLAGESWGAKAEECTSLAVLPEQTAEGALLAGQNWDWYTWAGAGGVVLEILSEDHPDLMIITEAGQLARYGMNKAGFVLGVNSLPPTPAGIKTGLPSTFMRRSFLSRPFWAESLSFMLSARHCTPHYYFSACAPLDAQGIEALPDQVLLLEPKEGVLTHSNHILHSNGPVQYISEGDTVYRHRQAERLLRREAGRITRETVKSVLRDHFCYPYSICRHPDERDPELDHISSIGSILWDVTEKKTWVCAGQPCQNEYREYQWSR